MSAKKSSSQYLLLLRQPSTGPHPSPSEMKKIMARFGEWMADMVAQGAVACSHGLGTKGKVLRGRRGKRVTDGPYPEAKEIVGGYILVNAASMAQAVKLARGCPGLDYRMAVEVRPVKH